MSEDISSHVSNINEVGYTVLESIICESLCENYKSILNADYSKYARLYAGAECLEGNSLANKSGEKVVFNLHNKNEVWFDLFMHEQVLKILDSILKEGSYKNSEPYYLYNISARSPNKGGGFQQLHSDSNLPGVNYCLVANVIWAFDDFSIDNGATRIVPGSHRFRGFAPDGEIHDDEVRLVVPRGSVIIFNANCWHGGATNFTDHDRWALVLGYARWFIKPSFDYFKCTPPEVYSKLSDDQKRMLGFYYAPPKDEFTRLRRIASIAEAPELYELPRLGVNVKNSGLGV
jgi:ectoine hydroxylase-related dioxygenase (phytanoyl-CoA dioxygenase family)